MSPNKHSPTTARDGSNPESSRQLPKVSIGLPVFNGERYLREAMDSLLGQSFRDFELIVSDNASTDSTAEIIREYQAMDPRVIYIRQAANIGATKNFLFVLGQAKSELFMWASHDDIWARNWLEVLTDNIEPSDIGIRGRLILTCGGEVVADKILPNFRRFDFVHYFLGNENNFRSHYSYSLFHREKLLDTEIESINSKYYPDAILVYCLLEAGALRTIETTYLYYRLHEQNQGASYSRKWKGWRKLLYRVHPLRYYADYLHYSGKPTTKLCIFLLIPVKHTYAQFSFWLRGLREIITGKRKI